MTQNTQTTADRLFVLMGEPRLWDTTHDEAERRAVAKTIAAEIDVLTAERDEARAEELAEARGELAKVRRDWELNGNLMLLKVETLTGELAEARAEVEQLRMAYGLTFTIPGAGSVVVDPSDPVRGMLAIIAAVSAEVERLRLPAEAWETLLAAYEGHGSSIEYAYSIARARAAKAAR